MFYTISFLRRLNTMKGYLLIISFCCLLGMCLNEDTKKISLKQIADKVNNKKDHPWKASSYDFNEIDGEIFKSTRLGVLMEKNPPKLSIQNYDYDFAAETLRKLKSERENDNPIAQDSTQLPVNFTWANAEMNKTHNCSIKIKDQSNCGSCWAISAVSAFGDRLCLSSEGKMKFPLSANLVTACNKLNHGCSGGFMSYVYDFLKYKGTVTGGEYESDEGCQPYSIRPCGFPHHFPCSAALALNPKCKNGTCTNQSYPRKKENTFYRANSAYNLYTVDSAMRDIYDNGPITATFYVYPDFMTYKKGVYIHTVGLWALGGHAVRVVGWGVENGVKYWHVSNSWGDLWGENGYFKIIRGINNCAFETMMQAAKVEKSKQ